MKSTLQPFFRKLLQGVKHNMENPKNGCIEDYQKWIKTHMPKNSFLWLLASEKPVTIILFGVLVS